MTLLSPTPHASPLLSSPLPPPVFPFSFKLRHSSCVGLGYGDGRAGNNSSAIRPLLSVRRGSCQLKLRYQRDALKGKLLGPVKLEIISACFILGLQMCMRLFLQNNLYPTGNTDVYSCRGVPMWSVNNGIVGQTEEFWYSPILICDIFVWFMSVWALQSDSRILIRCCYASYWVSSTCISGFSGFTFVPREEVAIFTVFINVSGQARMSQVYKL